VSTATVTDLFCGAGGSSEGAAQAGLEIVMAANHWRTAIDVHQANHPDARHDCADISQADPRRYPATDVLLASPECTNHSQAKGVSRRKQDESLFDSDFDPAAERSRATMWCVGRFAEQNHYPAIVVENVVEATKWTGWRHWLGWMTDLGYDHRVLSHNSMHHGVPQSRDRIYVVFTKRGIDVDLELEAAAWCPRCDDWGPARQAFNEGRWVGRYRQQWRWRCTSCGTEAFPPVNPAASIIDWDLACPRIGDRARPLADKTRARILAGLRRYGWLPIVTNGAGNTWERTPGMRARPLTDPLPTQQTTAQHAVVTPTGFLVRNYGNLGGDPGRHVTPVDEPARTMTTSPGMAFLVQTAHGGADRVHGLDRPHPTVTAQDDRLSLVVPLRSHGHAQHTDDPVPTVTAGGNHHGLLMRNNSGGAEMVTPTDEPARAVTTKGHQSLLMPYYGTGVARSSAEPLGTVPTRDRWAMVDPDEVVDDCGFRMLEPHEIAAAMAFPDGYIPTSGLTKRDRVKLAGNAVTPPVMTWITGRILQALEATA